MRTKWEILEERLVKVRKEYFAARAELMGLENTPFTSNGTGKCSTCGAPLDTEADFAKHFLVTDERYLNLGMCPTRSITYVNNDPS